MRTEWRSGVYDLPLRCRKDDGARIRVSMRRTCDAAARRRWSPGRSAVNGRGISGNSSMKAQSADRGRGRGGCRRRSRHRAGRGVPRQHPRPAAPRTARQATFRKPRFRCLDQLGRLALPVDRRHSTWSAACLREFPPHQDHAACCGISRWRSASASSWDGSSGPADVVSGGSDGGTARPWNVREACRVRDRKSVV